MTALWTAASAKMATGGTGGGGWAASGVTIDSRQVQRGDLFVALQGPNHDGHDHVASAFHAGAAAAMVSCAPPDVEADAPLLTVPDTQSGLEALGEAARARFCGKVAALTGSVGKTGSKEMLRLVLSAQGLTSATIGNLNNHIGAPLTMARLPESAAFAVVELGMNHAGEIGPLSRMVRPEVALITRIAPAHIEFFDSLDGIADAKAEIFEGLQPGGTAIVNADDGYADRLGAAALRAGAARVMRFGEASNADARLVRLGLHSDRTEVEANVLGQRIAYEIGVPGKHWALNSLGVLLAAGSLGVDPVAAAEALAAIRPPAGRGATERLTLPQGRITLIDESYNASPAAMQAAFAVLTAHEPPTGGRRIAILGDMLELGHAAPAEHAALGDHLAELPVDLVYAAGPEMAAMVQRLRPDQRAGYAADTAAIANEIVPGLAAGDVVLVKGSLGIKMARIVDSLRAAVAAGSVREE